MKHYVSRLHVPEQYQLRCKLHNNNTCNGSWSKGKLICPNPECLGRDDEWAGSKQAGEQG